MSENAVSAGALDSRVRRAARRVGLSAERSRCRSYHYNAQGGYQLVDRSKNTVAYGLNYELSAKEVLDICQDLPLAD